MKWFTTIEYINEETGEVLKTREVNIKEYRVKETITKYKVENENRAKQYGIREITKIIRRHEQYKLF